MMGLMSGLSTKRIDPLAYGAPQGAPQQPNPFGSGLIGNMYSGWNKLNPKLAPMDPNEWVGPARAFFRGSSRANPPPPPTQYAPPLKTFGPSQQPWTPVVPLNNAPSVTDDIMQQPNGALGAPWHSSAPSTDGNMASPTQSGGTQTGGMGQALSSPNWGALMGIGQKMMNQPQFMEGAGTPPPLNPYANRDRMQQQLSMMPQYPMPGQRAPMQQPTQQPMMGWGQRRPFGGGW